MQAGADRRKYSRLVRQFMVRYWIPGDTNQPDLSQAKDISLGGISFTTYKAFGKGMKLALKIKLPGAEITPIGRVLESKPAVNSSTFCNTRIEFSDMREADKQILSDRLDTYLREKKT